MRSGNYAVALMKSLLSSIVAWTKLIHLDSFFEPNIKHAPLLVMINLSSIVVWASSLVACLIFFNHDLVIGPSTTNRSLPELASIAWITSKIVCSHEGKYYSKKIVWGSSKLENFQKEGFTKEKVVQQLKVDAKITCKSQTTLNSYWVVKTFEDNHNQKFVSPMKRIKMRSNRSIPWEMRI